MDLHRANAASSQRVLSAAVSPPPLSVCTHLPVITGRLIWTPLLTNHISFNIKYPSFKHRWLLFSIILSHSFSLSFLMFCLYLFFFDILLIQPLICHACSGRISNGSRQGQQKTWKVLCQAETSAKVAVVINAVRLPVIALRSYLWFTRRFVFFTNFSGIWAVPVFL